MATTKLKPVNNYLKNVTKSVTYAAMDVAKSDMMPNISDFVTDNKEFLVATYATLKNPAMAVRKSVAAIQKSKIYQALDYGARNVFEDLRTGNLEFFKILIYNFLSSSFLKMPLSALNITLNLRSISLSRYS